MLDPSTPSPAGPAPARQAPRAGDPRQLAGRLAQAIAEVLSITRAPHQLAGVVSPAVLRTLERAAGQAATRYDTAARRPVVRSVRLTVPCRDAIEACAVVEVGGRVRALAYRLEAASGRWQCTALRIG
jgi:hypothetical protein